MKKRVLAFLLTTLLPLTGISCSHENSPEQIQPEAVPNQNEETAPEAVLSRLEELGSRKFNGNTYTVLSCADNPTLFINLPADETTGEVINDTLYSRNKKIEEAYDVVLEQVIANPADVGFTDLRTSITAGDKVYDYTYGRLNNGLASLATEGMLLNLRDSTYLSLDKNWWSPMVSEQLTLNGKIFFTTGDICPSIYQAASACYLNTDLMQDYNITADVFSLVKEGKWTFDVLTEMVKSHDSDVNADGIMHTNDDFFGFIAQNNDVACNIALTGAGVQLVKNSGSDLELNLISEETVSVIETLQNLIPLIKFDTQNDIYNITFAEDRAIVIMHNVGTAMRDSIRNMDSDYILTPVPKASEAQESYRSLVNSWNDGFVSIPLLSDIESVSFLLEVLAYESYTSVRPTTYEVVLKAKNQRDPDSCEMVDVILNSIYLDYHTINNFGGASNKILDVIVNGSPVVSAMEEIEQMAQTQVSELMESLG